MRRLHNIFVKMNPTEFDTEALKVIKKRYKAMSTPVIDPERPERGARADYSDKQLDESLYHISISMLNNLAKEETPSAKRKLINEAFQLALEALGTVKDCGADDEDYLFSYLFCQVHQLVDPDIVVALYSDTLSG